MKASRDFGHGAPLLEQIAGHCEDLLFIEPAAEMRGSQPDCGR